MQFALSDSNPLQRHGSLLTFWRFTNRIIIIIIDILALYKSDYYYYYYY